MPTFQTGDVDSLIAGLTTATQGVLDFFVSGAGLWFTVAGFLIVYSILRRVLGIRRA